MSENSTALAEWESTVSNQHLLQLMDGLGELIMVLRLDGTCAWCNRAFSQLLDKPLDELVGKVYPLPQLRDLMVAEPPQVVESWIETPAGGVRLVRFSAVSGLDNEGCVESLLVTGQDMTPFYRVQHPLDVATEYELPAAAAPHTVARIEHALQRAQRAEEYVVFLSILISGAPQSLNESSYITGLERIANELRQKIRQGDTLARLDSGAYLLVLEQIDCPEAIATVVDKLSATLCESQPADMPALAVNIGVSISPDDGHESLELVDRAQQAMQRAVMTDTQVCYF
ncbi:MAG: diguanylate cyclase [Oceanospirillales bacterium]|nr:diguanylate cyclase [Oceanospirillales bacterium]